MNTTPRLLVLASLLSVCWGCSSAGNMPLDSVLGDGTLPDLRADVTEDAAVPPGDEHGEEDQVPPADTTQDTTVAPPLTVSPIERPGRVAIVENIDTGTWQPSGSRVEAEFWATPLPTTQEVLETAGDCVLLQGEPMMTWNCTPECAWGEEACIGGECVPYPSRAPAGTLTINGLNTTGPVVLEPLAEGAYPALYDLPDNLFDDGQAITVAAAGDVTPAFTMTAEGVEDLVVNFDQYQFEPGQEARFQWTPGTNPNARIQVLLETGWHGSPNLTTIWCETEDDGELVVPASLTEDFPIPSCGECEGSYISRYTRDVVDFGNGPIELFVASRVWFVAWWGGAW